jgi:hypothetical protein
MRASLDNPARDGGIHFIDDKIFERPRPQRYRPGDGKTLAAAMAPLRKKSRASEAAAAYHWKII